MEYIGESKKKKTTIYFKQTVIFEATYASKINHFHPNANNLQQFFTHS
jgi:hypothetical protein